MGLRTDTTDRNGGTISDVKFNSTGPSLAAFLFAAAFFTVLPGALDVLIYGQEGMHPRTPVFFIVGAALLVLAFVRALVARAPRPVEGVDNGLDR